MNPLVRADLAISIPERRRGVLDRLDRLVRQPSYNNYDNNVSRITENVLRRFAADTPVPAPAARTTTQSQGR